MTPENMKKRPILALMSAALLSACASSPVDHIVEAPDEWVYYAKEAKFGVNTDETIVSRPLKQTLADVSEYSAKCFNGKFVKTTQWLGGQVAGGINQYTSGVNHSGNGMDYFYVQTRPVNKLPYPSMPKNGYFSFASEISGDNKQTKIASYYGNHVKPCLFTVKQWANGNKTKCPDLS